MCPLPSSPSHSSNVPRSSEVIRAAYEAELPSLRRAAVAFPWGDRELYAQWLAQTHGYVAHTTRLTALAAALLPTTREELHSHLLKHAAEEAGHDRLLLDDLRSLGRTPDDFPLLPATVAFYQTAYYQIEHLGPLAIFGRILPLEGLAASACPIALEAVRASHGEAAGSFLRTHGEADAEHVARGFGMIESASPGDAHVIAEGMRVTCALYKAMLGAVLVGK